MGIENTTLRKIILVQGACEEGARKVRGRCREGPGKLYKKSWVSVRDDDAGILSFFSVFLKFHSLHPKKLKNKSQYSWGKVTSIVRGLGAIFSKQKKAESEDPDCPSDVEKASLFGALLQSFWGTLFGCPKILQKSSTKGRFFHINWTVWIFEFRFFFPENHTLPPHL